MHNNAVLTRTLLVTIPIAVAGLYFAGLGPVALLLLVPGIIVLIARRRSLPNALVGPGGGRWWVWSLVGLVMVGSSVIAGFISGECDELSWILFSLLFFAGALIVAASIVRVLAWKLGRPSTPSN